MYPTLYLIEYANGRVEGWMRIYDRLIGSKDGWGRSIAIHARAAGIVWHDRILNTATDRRKFEAWGVE